MLLSSLTRRTLTGRSDRAGGRGPARLLVSTPASSTRQVSSTDQPTSALVDRDRVRPARGATASRGPHAVCSNSPVRERPARVPVRCRRTSRPGRGPATTAPGPRTRRLARRVGQEVGVGVDQRQDAGRLAVGDHQRADRQAGREPARRRRSTGSPRRRAGRGTGGPGRARGRRRGAWSGWSSRHREDSHSVPAGPVVSVAVPPRSSIRPRIDSATPSRPSRGGLLEPAVRDARALVAHGHLHPVRRTPPAAPRPERRSPTCRVDVVEAGRDHRRQLRRRCRPAARPACPGSPP